MSEPIRVWAFHDAPEALRSLSHNGGDEDWLAVKPPGVGHAPWLDDYCALFGYSGTDEYDLPDGSTVYIGSHA